MPAAAARSLSVDSACSEGCFSVIAAISSWPKTHKIKSRVVRVVLLSSAVVVVLVTVVAVANELASSRRWSSAWRCFAGWQFATTKKEHLQLHKWELISNGMTKQTA